MAGNDDARMFPPADNGEAVPNVRADALAALEAASDTDRALEDLDEVRRAAHVCAGSAWTLNALSLSPNEVVRRAATRAQQSLATQLRPPLVVEAPIDSPVFRIGRRMEEDVTVIAMAVASPRPSNSSLGKAWTWLGLLLTVVASAMIVAGNWWLAVAGLAMRVVVSLRVGTPSNLPFEGYTFDGKASAVVYRCIGGHLSDAIPLLAMAWVLAAEGNPALAMLLMVALTAMLTVTLLRVAALQVGVQVTRLVLERLIRTGSIVVALACGELLSHTAGTPDAGWAWVAALGALSYAVGETIRTASRLHHDKSHLGGLSQIRVTVVQADGGVGALTNHVRRDEPVLAGFDGLSG